MKFISYILLISIVLYQVGGERKAKNDNDPDDFREIIEQNEGNTIKGTVNPSDRINNYDSKGIKSNILKNGRIDKNKIRKHSNRKRNRIEGTRNRGTGARIENEHMKNRGIKKRKQDNANVNIQKYTKKTRNSIIGISRFKKCRNCGKGRKKTDLKKITKCPEKMAPCQEGQVQDHTNPGCCIDCVLPCRKGQELINPCQGSNCMKCPEMEYHTKYNSACRNCSTRPIPHYSEDGYKCIQCTDCHSFKRVQQVECLPTRKGICSEECIDPKYVLDGIDCVPIPWQYYYETFTLRQADVVTIKSTPTPTSEQNAVILPKEQLFQKNISDGQNNAALFYSFLMFSILLIIFILIIAMFIYQKETKRKINGKTIQSKITRSSDETAKTSLTHESNEETELKQMAVPHVNDGQQENTPETLMESSYQVNPATESMHNNSCLTENKEICIQASTVDSAKIVINKSPGTAFDTAIQRSSQNL